MASKWVFTVLSLPPCYIKQFMNGVVMWNILLVVLTLLIAYSISNENKQF